MRRTRSAFIAGLPCALLLFALGCGGSSSSSSSSNNNNGSGGSGGSLAANQVPLSVTNFNAAYVSVTVCQPGSSSLCKTVQNVEVDTGATGLRLLSSAVAGLALTNVTTSAGMLANCVQYLDNTYEWGPVSTVDVFLAGEVAQSVPIQIIAQPGYNFPGAPASCSDGGNPTSLSANGFIGLSFLRQDCGSGCASGTPQPGNYYACSGSSSSSCSPTLVQVEQQLQNPVGLFASDNNGVVVELQSVPANGLPSASGTLTFGIGTQADNALGNAVVLTANGSGFFQTMLTTKTGTVSTQAGFLDTGSNALYFFDTAETNLPDCTSSGFIGFYCPSATVPFTATNTGTNAATSTVSFSVADAQNIDNVAVPNIAGPGDSSIPEFGLFFDWGLPFFYGRSVFVAFEGQMAAGTQGPYWAY